MAAISGSPAQHGRAAQRPGISSGGDGHAGGSTRAGAPRTQQEMDLSDDANTLSSPGLLEHAIKNKLYDPDSGEHEAGVGHHMPGRLPASLCRALQRAF